MRRAVFSAFLGLSLTGCAQLGFTTTNAEPTTNSMYVMGTVADRFGQPLIGATVFNGADEFTTAATETQVSLGSGNGGSLLVPPGYFILKKNIATNNQGHDTIRAVFDGYSSSAISLDLTKKTTAFSSNTNYSLLLEDGTVDSEKLTGLPDKFNLALMDSTLSVPVDGPVPSSSDYLSCIKYLGQDKDGTVVTAPSVTAQASGSVFSYTPENGTVTLILQAPPGSQGTTITGYSVSYPLTASSGDLITAPTAKTLAQPVTVMPATANASGPKAYITIDTTLGNWATAMKSQGVGANALVTFYANSSTTAGNRVKRYEKYLNSSRQVSQRTVDLTATVLLKL